MKDYLLPSQHNSKSTYIKNFKINGDKIKVVFGDNSINNQIKNNKENLTRLETIMENQIKIGETNKERMCTKRLALALTGIITSCIAIFELYQTHVSIYPEISFTYSVLFSTITIIKYNKVLKISEMLNDLEKSQLYLNNKELFKQASKEKSYVLDGISKKSIRCFEKQEFSIKDVENRINLRDMKKILETEKKKEQLNLDFAPVIYQKKKK